MSKIAICNCGSPLISTFMFSGAEYFCMECGSSYGMFDTDRVDSNPELEKRHKRLEAKWEKISKHLLTGGVMFRSCDTCTEKREAHINHATEEELKLHKAALKKVEKVRL